MPLRPDVVLSAARLLSALRALAKSTRSSRHRGCVLEVLGSETSGCFLVLCVQGGLGSKLLRALLLPVPFTRSSFTSSSASCPGRKNCSRARGFLAKLLQKAPTLGTGQEGLASQPAAAVWQLLGIPVKSKRCRGAEPCPQNRCRRGRKSSPVGRYLRQAELGSAGASPHAALLAAPVLHLLPPCGIRAVHPEELMFKKKTKKCEIPWKRAIKQGLFVTAARGSFLLQGGLGW